MRRCPTYLEFEIDFLLGNKEILILAADIHDSLQTPVKAQICWKSAVGMTVPSR
jgi:hypothetical protein